MAIVKMIPIKECGTGNPARHLGCSIDYVCNPEKTTDANGNQMVYGINCNPASAFEQMKTTKELYNKTEGRQGYHIILSFKEGETDHVTVAEFAKDFVGRYLNNAYEAVIAVHNNTRFPHAHIVFNSVNLLDGYKYYCAKGEVRQVIQPLVNRMCEEYQLSKVPDREKDEAGKTVRYWNEHKDGPYVWSDMIRKDLDEVINETIMEDKSFFDFIRKLKERGYDVKHGKYLAVRPQGMTRFRRLYQLGEDYTEANIRERIEQKRLVPPRKEMDDAWVHAHRWMPEQPESSYGHSQKQNNKNNSVRKMYLFRIYEVTELKKQKYSVAWKFRKDIQKLEQLKKQYELLTEHKIESESDIKTMIEACRTEEYSLKSKRRKLYQKRRKDVSKTFEDYEKECIILSQSIKEKKLLREALEQIEQDIANRREQQEQEEQKDASKIKEGEVEDGRESTRIL